ncbi:type II secretion system F family protein [Candidatus Shapirobacteria bacterium]|nr:type II secretion system F family protein [Candidatus Shapirobacteria bacterium]
MAKYSYRAKDWSGKMVKGELDMGNEREVVDSIRESGLIPLSVDTVGTDFFTEIRRKIKSRVKLKEVSSFTRQLSTMMTAGLALTDALALLKSQMEVDSGLYQVIDKTLENVRGGMPLGKSLEEFKNVFGEAYIASVSAGEEAGVLEDILSKLAVNLENQDEFRGKVKGAMVYPTIVMIGMVAVVFLMMIFVIPKLISLYADMGTAKMPAATQFLMNLSNFMIKTWYLFPIFIGGGIFLYSLGMKNEKFRLKKDQYYLKIPIIGHLSETSVMADTCRTLSMLLTAGISLVEALRIVASVSESEVYKRAYSLISERVQKGFSVSASFENTGVFPVIVNQMVSTGESTGKLDEVLLKVSSYFTREAEETVKSLTAAIEPMIMILLGVGVGFLMIAIVMPIYNLTSSF